MKRMKLRGWVVDLFAILMLYTIIVGGVILLNNRFEQINEQNTSERN